MYFKKIFLHGFKSFAEPTTIDLDEGITCIVGPNGSGKSNISDALRWVLGEQSAKSLRADRMDEVIFAGTASRKSRGMAEVTLTIDNSTGILPIDYSEVAITRRMYRSGESEYAINNNSCRLRDIRELIMDTGIGVEGYSIIGQGKIADIVSDKPENRRAIIEEAAGVMAYRTKKKEAGNKLNRAMSNLDRSNDIIGEIEGRIDGLREDSEKAAEYIELRDRQKTLEINITLKNIDNIKEKSTTLSEDFEAVTEKLEGMRERRESTERRLAESRDEADKLEQLLQNANEKLLTCIAEINSLVNRKDVSAERMAAIHENEERINGEIAAAEEKISEINKEMEDLEAEKVGLEQEMNQLKNRLLAKVDEFNAATGRYNSLGDEINTARAELLEITNRISDKKIEKNGLVAMEESLDKQKESLLAREDEEDASSELEERVGSLKAELSELSAGKAGLKEEAVNTARTQSDLAEREKQLDAEVTDLHIKLEQAKSRMKAMEEMEAGYDGYSHGVKFIMQSERKGICGVVADLISVPKGYETAIETALGATMQNIICETDRDAKQAIRDLKAAKAGRLTFLPLESIRPSGTEGAYALKGSEGFLGVGTDCVEFQESYRPVMEYLLGRIVLVDNMDNAVALSKRAASGLRLVTLEGEVITTVGAITGGMFKNKTANILERKGEIKALGEKVESLSSQEETARKELEEARKALGDAMDTIADINDRYRQLELDELGKSNELSRAEEMLASRREGKSRRESELAEIQRNRSNAERMISEIDEKINELSQLSAEKEAFIEEKLALVDERREEREKASEEVTAARVAVTAGESKVENLDGLWEIKKNALAELTSGIEEKQDRLAAYGEEKRSMAGDGHSAERLATREAEKQELEGYIAVTGEKKAQLQEVVRKASEEQRTMEEEYEELQDQKFNLNTNKTRFETQLENLKNKLWEDYEMSYIQAMQFKAEDFIMSPAIKESREIRRRMAELGDVNIGAIEEYREVSQRYEFLTTQRADIVESVDSLTAIIEEMDGVIKKRFRDCFTAIQDNFEAVYTSFYGGGEAHIYMTDEDDPLESGVEISARPPGKKLVNINLLSGGEKTMAGIAFMFAVLKSQPTPFCILDEMDAALDDANIEIFGKYLHEFSNIQFALITHQKGTMEYADALYGVTMPEKGISELLSLRLGDDFKMEN